MTKQSYAHLLGCQVPDGSCRHWVPAYWTLNWPLDLVVAVVAHEMAASALVNFARRHVLTYRALEHVLHPNYPFTVARRVEFASDHSNTTLRCVAALSKIDNQALSTASAQMLI